MTTMLDRQTDKQTDRTYKCLVPYLKYLFFAVASGVIVYFTLMSNDLVNNIDGIWHPSNFIAGDWEISL